MEYRALGNSGLSVSFIGFGAYPIGGRVKYWPSVEEDAISAIRRARDLGINCFDTARAYGRSEELLARALKPKPHDVVIVTKCGLVRDPVAGTQRRDSRPAAVRKSVEESLRRLQTDCLDVLLIHWPDENTAIEDTMVEMNKLLEAGKTRYIGVSNFKRPLLDRAAGLGPIAANEISYNMLDRGTEQFTLPYCLSAPIGVLTHGTLAYGWLAGQIGIDAAFSEEIRSRGHPDGLPFFEEKHFEPNKQAVHKLAQISRRYGGNLPQLAVRWQRRQPAVTSALIGFRTPAEVDDAVKALDWQLPEAALDEAEAVALEAYLRMRPDQIPWPPVQPPHMLGVIGAVD